MIFSFLTSTHKNFLNLWKHCPATKHHFDHSHDYKHSSSKGVAHVDALSPLLNLRPKRTWWWLSWWWYDHDDGHGGDDYDDYNDGDDYFQKYMMNACGSNLLSDNRRGLQILQILLFFFALIIENKFILLLESSCSSVSWNTTNFNQMHLFVLCVSVANLNCALG